MTTAAAEIGSSASSYEIFGKLARGGMAEIFLARAATGAGVSRFVVLKRVLQERATDLQFLQMFLDEARLAAQLQHPNIAQVYDVGRLGDSYFFTMEYVHGVTLRELMHGLEGHPLPVGAALAVAAGAAAGLHHAHERIGVDGRHLGIVHRDVSPSNLMVSFEGHVKVVDFGIAKATSRTQETHSGTVRGKISYLSPEQAVGANVDRRSDVFSLGIVMWELLTGRRLYKRDSDYASMAAVIDEPVPMLPPDVPQPLAMIVMRALAKRPEERFQTAQEMLEAIEHTASAIGTPISTASLSRFVREVFGPRPEPWAGIPAKDLRASVVTVNAEPLPKQLIVPPASEIDRKLATVIDLQATGLPIDPRQPRMMIGGQPVMRTTPAMRPIPRRGLSPLWIGILSFVLAIGLVIGARMYLRKPAATVPMDAGTSITMAVTDNNEGAPADAAEAVATVELDAAVVPTIPEADAAVVVPFDIETDAGVPTEVEAPVVTKPAPSPPPRTKPRSRSERNRPDPKPRAEAKPKPAESQLSPDWQEFATCASTNAASGATSCVLVACRLQEDGKARKWFAKVPSGQRANVIATCKIEGVEVEPPKPAD